MSTWASAGHAGVRGGLLTQTSFHPHATGCLSQQQTNIVQLVAIDPADESGQKNLRVGCTSPPAMACSMVWNPTREQAPGYFEVRQPFDSEDHVRTLWATWEQHPALQFWARAPGSVPVSLWILTKPMSLDARKPSSPWRASAAS